MVYNHAPGGYRCPFCRNLATGEAEHPLEVLHRYEEVFVKLNPRWRPANPGAALVVPNEHHENLYDLPPRLGGALQAALRDTALAMKEAFGCAGVSVRQHNEPAGGQDVWHYHLHVLPRYQGDDLDGSAGEWVPAGVMAEWAARLRGAWPS